jgi:glutathione S-transferase
MRVLQAAVRPKPFWLTMSISQSAAPACEEKARLLRLCAVAESNHQHAIQRVTWLLGRSETPNYEDLNEFVETARRIVDEAQQALERHTAEQGC